VAASCSPYQPIDTAAELRESIAERAQKLDAASVEIPFEIDDEIIRLLEGDYKVGPNELHRVEQVLDLIFRRLDLRYAFLPTRSAIETFRAREGNCLSFVNLFVGVARHQRLAPFYVEVTDYQRWSYQEGTVVSRGHIVAGMYLKGELRTYDFLPYRPKAYKDFEPISDATATAHYYNNLGAEALLKGDTERAVKHLRIAHSIDPEFVKGLNNLGVAHARRGEIDEAVAAYERGLEIEPDNVALLTNLARAYQQTGRAGEAAQVLTEIEVASSDSAHIFIYQGEQALARGEPEVALEHMREALSRDTEVPEVHLGLVKVYLAMGELNRARHHLGRALRLDATHPEARAYAAMLADKPANKNDGD
jgi:Flp pilus assembly protein TadD